MEYHPLCKALNCLNYWAIIGKFVFFCVLMLLSTYESKSSTSKYQCNVTSPYPKIKLQQSWGLNQRQNLHVQEGMIDIISPLSNQEIIV